MATATLCLKSLIILLSLSLISATNDQTDHDHYLSILGYAPHDLSRIDRLMRLFESWMDRHGKKYHSLEEKLQRFEVFRDNLEYINETNKKVKGYRLGLNEFADMTRDEFKQKHSGFKIDLPKSGKSSPEFTDKDVKFEALPKAVD